MNNNFLRFFMFLLISGGIISVVIYRDQIDLLVIQQWLEDAGNAAPIFFMFVYVAATVFFFPGSIFTLLGGALFGPVWGVIYTISAATIGSMLAFLIARYLASDWVEKKTGGTLKRLMTGIDNEGWRFVAFVRLVPLFPFNLLNYALGLTRIPFSQYSLATFIFMLPGATAYTYLGYIGKEAATGGEDLVQKIMLALALLGVVAFLPKIIASMRQMKMLNVPDLKQRLDEGEDVLVLDVRTPEDYVGGQGHIAGSMLLPLEELSQRLDEIASYQDKKIVTICRTDRKSSSAAKLLLKKGFTDVQVAKMGMTDWIKNDYPIEH